MREIGQTDTGLHLRETGLARDSKIDSNGDLKVLVVDNDSFVREIIAKILNVHLGLSVVTAASGSKAIAESLSGEYLAAIIELNLPDTSGVEAIKAISDIMPGFPIIAIASAAVKKRDEYVKRFGIRQLFYKPVRISSLICEMRDVLKTSREKLVGK